MLKTIDLFAGAGGFSVGFVKAGFDIVAAVEYDSQIAETYSRNHLKTKMYNDDIKNVDNNHVFSKGDADIIIGGPPCQGFSMAGARIRNGFIDDPRNYLFKHYFNIVKIVKPKIFIIENVKGLVNIQKGSILNEIIKIFEDSDNFNGNPYKVQYIVLNSKDFGIPQNRERVFIVGSLIDINLKEEIERTKNDILSENKDFFSYVSVWDAISNLSNIDYSDKINIEQYESFYQRELRSNDSITWNHVKTNHSKKSISRMSQIKIDENFEALNEQINSVHSGSYGRLNPKGIAPTVTTRFDTPSGGRFIHPIHNRTLTPREAARIQSFPDEFKFYGTRTSINTQIGNAVPPKLSYFLGRMIRRILCNQK